MKRLAWLLMFVVGTVLAQVRPATVLAHDEVFCCCGVDCACTVPECAPPPTRSGALSLNVSPATTLRIEVRSVARVAAAKVFYAEFVPAAVTAAGLAAPVSPVPTAGAPLFAVLCCLRI